MRNHHYKTGQATALTAKAVAEPGADTRTTGNLGAGLQESYCRIMVDGISVHGVNHADFIRNLRGVWKQFTDPRSRCTMLLEPIS